MSETSTSATKPKRRVWTIAKWVLCLAVVGFVGKRGYELWQQDAVELEVEPAWLVLAGIVYVIGWFPSVWFWREAMRRLGGSVSVMAAARAYYCGHLGKYIPGKAMVLVIRGSMVAECGSPMRIGMLTAAYETLVMMGAGLALGAALSPQLFASAALPEWLSWLNWIIERPVIGPIVAVVAGLAALPVAGKLLEKIGRKFVPKSEQSDSKEPGSRPSVNAASTPESNAVAGPSIDSTFLLMGTLVFVVGWMIHGLSLGLTLRAVTPTNFDWSNWLVWAGAGALATSVGFIAIFAPGGVGIREGLIGLALTVQPTIEPGQAVAAALLLRVVWLLTEVTISLVLLKMSGQSLPSTSQSAQ